MSMGSKQLVPLAALNVVASSWEDTAACHGHSIQPVPVVALSVDAQKLGRRSRNRR